MTSIGESLSSAAEELAPLSESAKLDAEILLACALEKDRSYLFAFPETELTQTQLELFNHFLSRRLQGEPIAHITGQREFWSLNFHVTADTLIPRPDTEALVEFIVDHFNEKILRIIDMGTGSGAIAIALASEKPGWQITATDQSAAALTIARENAHQHHCNHIQFLQSNWFAQLEGQHYDLIVSNPPYIPANDPHLSQGDVRFDPHSALVAGMDGLDDLKIIIQQAPQFINPEGWLIVEHGYDQAQAVQELFNSAGFKQVKTHHDYGGNPRFTTGQR